MSKGDDPLEPPPIFAPLVSHRYSHHVVTRSHHVASYVAGIPRGNRHGPPDRKWT